MATRKKKGPTAQKWSPTELLYAVTGWLTTRKQPIVLGSNYNAAPIAELLGEVIKLNKLEPPRDTYPKIKVAVDLDHLTNKDSYWNPNAVATPPLSPDEAVGLFATKLREMSLEDQDLTLASFLDQVRKDRSTKLANAAADKRHVENDYQRRDEAVWNLEKILRGDFYVIKPSGPMALTKKASQ